MGKSEVFSLLYSHRYRRGNGCNDVAIVFDRQREKNASICSYFCFCRTENIVYLFLSSLAHNACKCGADLHLWLCDKSLHQFAEMCNKHILISCLLEANNEDLIKSIESIPCRMKVERWFLQNLAQFLNSNRKMKRETCQILGGSFASPSPFHIARTFTWLTFKNKIHKLFTSHRQETCTH